MNSLRVALVFVSVGMAACGQKPGAPVPEWRRSAVKFREALESYQKSTDKFPKTSFDFMAGGGVVPNEWEVMRRFGGDVEWEGTFEGFEKDGNLAGRPQRIKFTSQGMMLHVYPKDNSVAAWQKLPPKAAVRYKASIEGIAGFPFNGIVMMVVSLKDAVLLGGSGPK